MIAELERRTRETFEDETSNHADYVDAWLSSGQTLAGLAASLSESTSYDIMRESLARYLREAFGQDDTTRQRAARARGSYALIDETLQIADERVTSNEDNGRNRNRISARQWAAERFNREELGAPKGPLVAISIGSLHLDALRSRGLPVPPSVPLLSIEGEDETANVISDSDLAA